MSLVVEVTWHALEQFESRFPDEWINRHHTRLQIADEVMEALEACRYSTKQPRWARIDNRRPRGRRNKKELDRTLRFVWTEDRGRMYLVDRHDGFLRVVTSIRPTVDNQSE